MNKKTPEERFWEKVEMIPFHECWEWIAYKNKLGYGVFRFDNKTQLAHRISWFLKYNIMPDRLVLHKCDNPGCVNPNHLFLGTDNDNAQDKVNKNRQAKGYDFKSVKHTEEDIKEIRKLYSTGDYTTRKLAKMFGTCNSKISDIINRKRWKHI